MSKSLGEKLHDAARTVWTFRKEWDDDCKDSRTEHERIALAFCASLSHDETATATIEALKAERDSLLAALKETADSLADELAARYDRTLDHPAMKRRYDRDMEPVIKARALTAKEG